MSAHPAGEFGTLDLERPDTLSGGATPDGPATWRRSFGWSATSAPVALLLGIGLALGPTGINLLSPTTLAVLDPAVPVALAALGALVAMGVGGGWGPHRLLAAAWAESAITLIVVAAGIAGAASFLAPEDTFPVWIVAASGICAATSLTLPAADPLEPSAPWIRLVEVGVLLPLVAGGVALPLMQTANAIAAVILLAQSCVVILAAAIAAWLLLAPMSSETEERVVVIAALLLVGGIAAALAQSALFAGSIAGLFWRYAGRRARETIRRDILFVQHPLLVLVLLVAGARSELSPLSLALGAGYVLLRTGGKLLGGAIADRVVAPRPRGGFGWHLLRPGVFGVAFALNAFDVAGADAALLLATVVVGTIGAEFVALLLRPHGARV